MRYIAVDTETAGLEARYDASVPLWCVGFSDGDKSYTLTNIEVIRDHVRNLLLDDSVCLVFHNGAFDVPVLRLRGVDIPPGRYVDSLLCSYLLDTSGEHSLAHWGTVLGGTGKVDIRQRLIEEGILMKGCSKADVFRHNYHEDVAALQLLESYCEADAELCLKVWNYCAPQLHKDTRLTTCYYTLELPYVEVIIEMESTGIYVDVVELQRLHTGLSLGISKLSRRLVKLVPYVPSIKWNGKAYDVVVKTYKNGVNKNKTNVDRHYTDSSNNVLSSSQCVYDHCELQDFNPNAGDHLAYVLMSQGWKPTKLTDSKKISTEASVLSELSYPLAKLYTQINTLSKLDGTFVKGLLDAQVNGFVHTNYNQCVTRTTRLSSSNPNLQNLPSRSRLGKRIRECVIAPPGYELVLWDCSQIELRVLAHYLHKVVGETRMADACRAGKDLHQANSESWNCTRSKAKNGIFAVNYGSQAPTLSKTIGCGVEEAQALLDSIAEGMPLLIELKAIFWNTLRKKDGYFYDILGHRLHYPNINSTKKWERLEAERQSFNALIQSGAGAIFKELQLRALGATRRYHARACLSVHDELGSYVLIGCVTEVKALMANAVNTCDVLSFTRDGETHTVPIKTDVNSATNWLEAK